MNILYLLLAVITEILISINYDLQNWILLCCVKIKAYYTLFGFKPKYALKCKDK